MVVAGISFLEILEELNKMVTLLGYLDVRWAIQEDGIRLLCTSTALARVRSKTWAEGGSGHNFVGCRAAYGHKHVFQHNAVIRYGPANKKHLV